MSYKQTTAAVHWPFAQLNDDGTSSTIQVEVKHTSSQPLGKGFTGKFQMGVSANKMTIDGDGDGTSEEVYVLRNNVGPMLVTWQTTNTQQSASKRAHRKLILQGSHPEVAETRDGEMFSPMAFQLVVDVDTRVISAQTSYLKEVAKILTTILGSSPIQGCLLTGSASLE